MGDLEGIFELFENVGGGKIDDMDLNEFTKSPLYRLKMFEKIIVTGNNFKSKVLNFFSSGGVDIDIEDMEEVGDFMMYARAWYWIESVNLEESIWVESLMGVNNFKFLGAIKSSISYFEKREEYEKCFHLKKIQDIVEKNLELYN